MNGKRQLDNKVEQVAVLRRDKTKQKTPEQTAYTFYSSIETEFFLRKKKQNIKQVCLGPWSKNLPCVFLPFSVKVSTFSTSTLIVLHNDRSLVRPYVFSSSSWKFAHDTEIEPRITKTETNSYSRQCVFSLTFLLF